VRKETYYIGVYWGARRESPREIAVRLAATMRELSECHHLLSRWNEKADTFDEALRLVVEPTPEALAPLFTTIEPEEPTTFGYDLRLWNGRPELREQCTLGVRSGMVQISPTMFSNLVLVYLTCDPDTEPELHAPATVLRVLEILARVWRPDWGMVMSNEYSTHHEWPDEDDPRKPGTPKVGWMTYLRAERLAHLPERVPFRTVDVDGIGTIFVVTDDHRFTVDNPEDIARAHALRDFLQEHGALETIPTNLPI
jgi:hypothetical protein